VKERKRAIAGKRYVPMEPSSDDYQMNDDESEDEEDIMKDEVNILLKSTLPRNLILDSVDAAFPEDNGEHQ